MSFFGPRSNLLMQVKPSTFPTSPTAFHALMNEVVSRIPGTTVYTDDTLVFSDCWDDHVNRIGQLFCALSQAGSDINLKKCDFHHA